MKGTAERNRSRWRALVPWVALVFIIVAGLGLRLGYFLNGDPFVDEWATMLVARGIWEQGLPFLPSGTLYARAMLFSYLDALLLAVVGWTPVVAQLPSLLAGVLTIPLAYFVGRQLFAGSEVPVLHGAGDTADSGEQSRTSRGKHNLLMEWRGEAVGLLAAALLALDPIAIIWSGRARAYTLEQVFVLLAILWLHQRRYILFSLAFVGALFSHAEAALLLPGFALGLLLGEGWSIIRRPKVWLATGISLVAIAVRLVIHRQIITGTGGRFEVMAVRPAIQLSLDIAAGFRPLLPFFTESYRLVAALLFLVGLAFAVRAWRRQDRKSGYLLLYPLCLVTLAEMLTVVGQSWKDPRYLLMLLPAFFVLAGATAVDLLIWIEGRSRVPAWLKVTVGVLLIGLLLIPPLPEALNAANKLEEGYGPTLAYVRDQWQSDDTVAGWAAPAIAVELGQIDYFAMQIGNEEFIMEKDGIWVDRWVGAPLMDSVEQLEAALDQPGRLWFLTDEFRFRARYTPEFAQAIWDRMEPVFRYHNALAFVERSTGEPAYHRDVEVEFERGLDLAGYDLDPAVLGAGDTLTVTLHWQARDWVDAPYTAFVHLLDPEGQGLAQDDGPPFDGLHPTDHWLRGERLRDERHLTVPADASPGRYQLEVGWYDPETLDRLPLVVGGDSLTLALIPLGQKEVERPGTLVNAQLGGQVELVGYDLLRNVDGRWVPLGPGKPLRAGERLTARLVWKTLAEMEQDYTVFVHLNDPDAEFWGQDDGQPVGGAYPTSFWREGEWVVDEHELVVQDGVAGDAELLVGMYLLETMDRLSEPVSLGWIKVKP